MWNTCNTNASRCGYGYQNLYVYPCVNTVGSLFGTTQQSICRDGCGNIRVRTGYNCCPCSCHCGCHCGCGHCGCGNNDGNGTQGNQNGTQGNSGGGGNQNGGFTCVTFCGNTGNTLSAANTNTQTTMQTCPNFDWYYARQYGLLPRRTCGCGCGGMQAYNTFVDSNDD